MHHQLVNGIQMLGEFESFYYNMNVYNVSWFEKPNLLPAPHLIWYIDFQIPGKGFFIVLIKSNRGRRKFLFLYPLSLSPFLSEKILGPMPSKVDVMKFLQFIMT